MPYITAFQPLCSHYENGRSSTLLKIKVQIHFAVLSLPYFDLKSFYDAEAEVTGYVEGKGRNAGVTGALKCKMASGKVCAMFNTHQTHVPARRRLIVAVA